jgi:hypothetical protein
MERKTTGKAAFGSGARPNLPRAPISLNKV